MTAHDHGVPKVEGTGGYHPHESPWTMLVPLACWRSARSSPACCSTAPSSRPRHGRLLARQRRLRRASRARHARGAGLGEMVAVRRDADRPGDRLPQLHPQARCAAGGVRRQFPRRAPLPAATNGISTSSTTSSSSARRCGSAGCSGSAATRQTSTASARTARRYAVGVGNRITARLQSGYLYSYALVMLLGLIGAATWVFWWVR